MLKQKFNNKLVRPFEEKVMSVVLKIIGNRNFRTITNLLYNRKAKAIMPTVLHFFIKTAK